MKFWTALQYPLCQAALVEDGRICKTIPVKPPRTPARRVGLVADYDGKLVVGRRNSIELWDRQGQELLECVYHRWIYGLHGCLQIDSDLLLACSTLDVVFRLDFEGRSPWSWWAHHDGLAAEPRFLERQDWPTLQLTQQLEHDTAHLNSIRLKDSRTVLATLRRRRAVVEIDLSDPSPKSKLVRLIQEPQPHDFQYHEGKELFGTEDSLVVGGAACPGYSFVKRIIVLAGGRYLFTHEEGVVEIDGDGRVLASWTLPRPFGFACIEP